MFSILGFHYPLYGKTAGREDSEGAQSSKPVTDSTALELLSHPLLPYHGKSPVVCISLQKTSTPFLVRLTIWS